MRYNLDLKYLKHLAKRGASFIHPKGYGATQLLIQKLDIKHGDKIIEIGCGTGATLVEIASGFDVKIDGLDVLDEMLDAAKERIKFTGLEEKITLFKCEINEPLPFQNGAYDKVFMESVIGFQPAEGMNQMLSEIFRVLKKGGIFIANEALWKDNIPGEVVENISRVSDKDFGLAQASPDNINLERFTYLAKSAGFDVKEIYLLDKPVSTGGTYEESKRFSRAKKIGSLLSFSYLFDEIKYYFKLMKHKRFGKNINSYLFVLKKNK